MSFWNKVKNTISGQPKKKQVTIAHLGNAVAGNGARVALQHKLYLTLKESSEYAGLPVSYLRRLIEDGSLPVLRARGYRIKRTDLEQI